MKPQKIERVPETPFLPGFEDDTRTDAELVKSIRGKREKQLPLDAIETAFVDIQSKEDKEDLRNTYPH